MALHRELMKRLGRTDAFARWGPGVIRRVDEVADRVSGGRVVPSRWFIPQLWLTTTGRRSGQPRTVPVLYVDHPGGVVVVGSSFGQPQEPAWVLNLLADPVARVRYEDGREERVRARVLDPGERVAVWPRLLQVWPAFDRYVERAQPREIKVFQLVTGSATHDAGGGRAATR